MEPIADPGSGTTKKTLRIHSTIHKYFKIRYVNYNEIFFFFFFSIMLQNMWCAFFSIFFLFLTNFFVLFYIFITGNGLLHRPIKLIEFCPFRQEFGRIFGSLAVLASFFVNAKLERKKADIGNRN